MKMMPSSLDKFTDLKKKSLLEQHIIYCLAVCEVVRNVNVSADVVWPVVYLG